MDGDKAGAGIPSRFPQPLSASDPPMTSPPQTQPPQAPAPAPAQVPAKKPAKETPALGKRLMFTVELRRGETTIVSWKKLLRESGSGNGDSSAVNTNNATADTRAVVGVHPGEDDLKHTLQPPNCFSAVIEKIERLYMGKESSDDEELDAPDDDQYDTEDSFIDDTELDEYFQVDKLSTKHNGYFVNRGKLEWVEPSSSPSLTPKKRRRKDSTKAHSETDHEHVPNEHPNMGSSMKIKAAARNAPLMAKKFSPAEVSTSFDEHYRDGKHLKAKMNASTGIHKKRTSDFATKSEVSPSAMLTNKNVSSVTLEPKDFDKRKILSSKDLPKSSGITESFCATNMASREIASASKAEPQSKKLFSGNDEMEMSTKMHRKDKPGYGEYPHSSSMAPHPTQAAHPSPHQTREGTIRPKGTAIERAIRDLQKIVELSRPSEPGVQENDPFAQGVKRRLPQEIKQKLAKVARLSASQSKISEDELVNRLMGFLGHLVQRKTLKRNMREMVELGLSAKQLKADKFLQIKKEVLEMIKERVSLLVSKVPDQQDGLMDDFQDVVSSDEKRALRGRYCMDAALEDKICDLYDLHVEGMDEDKGPQSRKLYAELAELWPAGYMDNFGIKDAIYRAKKRRRHKFQSRDDGRPERKNTAISMKPEEPSVNLQSQSGQGRLLVDPPVQVSSSHDKQISNISPLLHGRLTDPAAYLSDTAQNYGYTSKHHEKTRGNGADAVSDGGSKAAVADVKRRMKRKSETEVEFHTHSQKMQAYLVKEKQSSGRPGDDSSLIPQQPKPRQTATAPASDQPS